MTMRVNDCKDLKTNLVEKIEDYAIKVPRGDRSHEITEPYLTDQWFVKIEPLAKPAIEAVESANRFILIIGKYPFSMDA